MTTLTSSFSFALTFVFLASGCTVDLNDLRGIPRTDAGRTETSGTPDAGMASPDANSIIGVQPSDIDSTPDAETRTPDTGTPVMPSDADMLVMASDAGTPIMVSDAGTPTMSSDTGIAVDTQSTDRGPPPDSFPDYKPSTNPDALSFQPDVTPQPKDLQPSLKPLGSPCSINCDKSSCECASGFCDVFSSNTGKCSTKLPLGAACGVYDEVCQSGRCFFNKCELNCYPFCQDAG